MPDVQQCPACRSQQIRRMPASRATGRTIVTCPVCGMSAHGEYDDAPPQVVDEEQITPELYAAYVAAKRDGGRPEIWREMLGASLDLVGSRRGTRVFDVGAGDGGFLQLARDEFGCEVFGNETSAAAVRLAEERHAVRLELGDIGTLGHRDEFDIVTMWCVLAHVPNGDHLLADALAMLRPGGCLVLQTPHRTFADRAALGMAKITDGRVTKVSDRRLPTHHRILHTPASMELQLTRLGYTDVVATPKARYSLSSELYLYFAGLRGRALKAGSRVMDQFVDRGLAPRIVLDVTARKPA
ncbi:class I SAM-dependent methyltransferase [Nocardioides sp. BYT-33-1]|uniref:class I SAM-dependent methyltransferase n=1 Tax=Nocardioides sp. BYT-33-1 TaxID=3416952 RepID=UPI003F53BB77